MSCVVAPLQYYTEEQAAKMVGVSRARLRAWARAGIGARGDESQGEARYTFQDLVALRSTKSMVERGVSLTSIRKGIEKLKEDAPGEIPAHCLARHRVLARGGSWSVLREGHSEDVHSGQLSFDYTGASQLAAFEPAGTVLSFPGSRRRSQESPSGPRPPESEDCAESWYAYGADCELLWDRSSVTDVYFRKAQQAYLKAVELDEAHAAAWTNLATLHATLGESKVARQYYELATRCDESLPEPFCNLAELDLREGQFEDAARRFESVLARDPEHLEAMYGLARSLIAQGEHDAAVDLLRSYCACLEELDPEEVDEELEQRWEGARLVIATHEKGYAAKSQEEQSGANRA